MDSSSANELLAHKTEETDFFPREKGRSWQLAVWRVNFLALGSIVGLQLVSENLHGGSLRLGVEEVVAAGAKEGGEGGGEGVGWGRGEVGRVARRRWRRVVAGRHVRWREVLGGGGRLRRHGGEGGWVSSKLRGLSSVHQHGGLQGEVRDGGGDSGPGGEGVGRVLLYRGHSRHMAGVTQYKACEDGSSVLTGL